MQNLARRLNNVQLTTKFTVAFLTIALIVVIVGGVGSLALNQVTHSSQQVTQRDFPGVIDLGQVRLMVWEHKADLLAAIAAPDPATTTTFINMMGDDENQITAAYATFKALSHPAAEQSLMLTYEQDYQNWLNLVQPMIQAASQPNHQQNIQLALQATHQLDQQTDVVTTALNNLMSFEQQRAQTAANSVSTTSNNMLILIVSMLIVATGLAIILGRFLSAMIVPPLQQVSLVVKRIAQGDLTEITQLVEQRGGSDSIGQLILALDQALEKLRTLIGRVTKMSGTVYSTAANIAQATDQTQAAASQVAQAIQQVAIGAQTQSAQLIDASNVTELLAKKSKELQVHSESTAQTMAELKDRIQQTAQQVRHLGERSSEIGQILQTITEIADQTNLLALNAAIEAARAGDHGRGFAVVAEEVRKLAERSADATKDIGRIVNETQTETSNAVISMRDGVEQVERGVERVLLSQANAIDIGKNIEEVNQTINAVAAVSEENGAAAEEVLAATDEVGAKVREVVEASKTIEEIGSGLKSAAMLFQWTYADQKHSTQTQTPDQTTASPAGHQRQAA